MSSNESTPVPRLTFLAILVGVLFLALISRLWFLQVLAGERYAQLAETNAVQIVYTEPPRGRILAADGAELVSNRPAQTISAHPRSLLDDAGEPVDASAAAVVDRLAALLDLPAEDILDRLTDRRYSPFRPVPIAVDVAPEVVFAVREHQELFPGVVAETLPVRTYPAGTTAAHVLGYVGEVSAEQLEQNYFAGYRAGDLVGRSGLERAYEHDLQGDEGRRVLEVNARGTVLDVVDVREPVPGNDLVTTIDLELQQEVERLLADGLEESRQIVRDEDGRSIESVAGSAVVLDPLTGAVRAMASLPAYDPRELIGGLSDDYAAFLFGDDSGNPLLNRAIQAAYPPASTFKVVTGASFLHADLIGTGSEVACPGSWSFGQTTFNNWNPRNEGPMAISTALMRSCDTFFYAMASQVWQREEAAIDGDEQPDEVMQAVARQFGFDDPLGIDLPGESGGIIPDRQWKQDQWDANHERWCQQAEETGNAILMDNCRYGYLWRGGESVNMSIGQGAVTATPLQVAAAYGAIANGGTLLWPHVGARVAAADAEVVRRIEPDPLNQLPLEDAEVAALQDGLERVVMDPRGTATSAFVGFPLDRVPVAGKTGTGEASGDKLPYAWFVAYAPVDDPRYVVAVAVEEGGGGSVTAAPIVRRILEAAFDLPVSSFRAGDPTD